MNGLAPFFFIVDTLTEHTADGSVGSAGKRLVTVPESLRRINVPQFHYDVSEDSPEEVDSKKCVLSSFRGTRKGGTVPPPF